MRVQVWVWVRARGPQVRAAHVSVCVAYVSGEWHGRRGCAWRMSRGAVRASWMCVAYISGEVCHILSRAGRPRARQ
ncbi:hypothetical protein GCM10010389_21170 [Streptomyces echinoruber]|uniref:Uncharacterized protein n=1 Tax=Streptomyces echinoruber TaxID=68898 RepID=A0A918R2Q3_9ACTN|nr:hypothetical protein GCM10010389_21170 [Streptomyces echinoruber]